MRAMLTLAVLSALLPSTAYAYEMVEHFREKGHFGLGLGAGTSVAGVSMKYFLADAFSIQGVVGLSGYGGNEALGVSADFLFEMPAFYKNAEALDIAWELGAGAYTWIGNDLHFGIQGVAGIQFNLNVIPLDIVLEYRPNFHFAGPYYGNNPNYNDGFYFDPVSFGGHIRFYLF